MNSLFADSVDRQRIAKNVLDVSVDVSEVSISTQIQKCVSFRSIWSNSLLTPNDSLERAYFCHIILEQPLTCP